MSTPMNADSGRRLAELFPAVQKAFAKWVDTQVGDTGMSPARVRLLGTLHCQGPRTMSQLGERLDVSARNITTLVDGLERDGAVRRVPHSTDRRATVIELTPGGLETVERLLEPFMQSVIGLFNELPEADRHELVRLMEAVAAILQRRTSGAGEATPGQCQTRLP
jgi:DNA-binding MarR family transcriptional regulator